MGEIYGGGKIGTTEQAIHRSLMTQRGTAYTTDADGPLWVEMLAYARAIAAAWDDNRRLSYSHDPNKMSDPILARWEKILKLRPVVGATDVQRRAAVAARFLAEGQAPNSQGVGDVARTIAKSILVQTPTLMSWLVHTGSGIANIHVAGGVTIPGGISVAAEAFDSQVTWQSSTSHVAILVAQPAAMDDATFYGIRGALEEALDPLLPSWVTFSVVRDLHPDGSGGVLPGFYLDEEHNLDNERFD